MKKQRRKFSAPQKVKILRQHLVENAWAEPDVRDEMVDYVRHWSDKTDIKAKQMVHWIGITRRATANWNAITERLKALVFG